MLKEIKANDLYFVIRLNEPYARKIFDVLKEEQIKLNDWPEGDLTFEQWVYQMYGEEGLIYIDS